MFIPRLWSTNPDNSIVSQLASCIDRNTLHALSRTCRQVRANLIQYRRLLVQQTLRCSNECYDDGFATASLQLPEVEQWHIYGDTGHIVSGKVSSCARDLVSDCRRCGTIVCRVSSDPGPPFQTRAYGTLTSVPSELYPKTSACNTTPSSPPTSLSCLPSRASPRPHHQVRSRPVQLHQRRTPLYAVRLQTSRS